MFNFVLSSMFCTIVTYWVHAITVINTSFILINMAYFWSLIKVCLGLIGQWPPTALPYCHAVGRCGGCSVRPDRSICWCWLLMAILFTCTGMGTMIFGLLVFSGPAVCLPWTRPAFTRFHFARRFWNQIFTCTSLSFSVCAICERSVRDRYFLLWNSFSSSSNCSLVKAVRLLRDLLPLPPPPPPEPPPPPPPDPMVLSPSQRQSSPSSMQDMSSPLSLAPPSPEERWSGEVGGPPGRESRGSMSASPPAGVGETESRSETETRPRG